MEDRLNQIAERLRQVERELADQTRRLQEGYETGE